MFFPAQTHSISLSLFIGFELHFSNHVNALSPQWTAAPPPEAGGRSALSKWFPICWAASQRTKNPYLAFVAHNLKKMFFFTIIIFTSRKGVGLQKVRMIPWKLMKPHRLMNRNQTVTVGPAFKTTIVIFIRHFIIVVFFSHSNICFLILRKKNPQNKLTRCDRFPSSLVHGKERNVIQSQGQRGATRAISTACCTRADKAHDAPQ